MRFKTIGDVLAWTRIFHEHLADEYIQLGEGKAHQRVGMLLAYLADHEQLLADTIERYETDAADSLLKTWYDVAVEMPLPASLSALKETLKENDTGTLVGLAVDFHESLTKAYTALMEQSPNTSTRELFANLAQMENHEQMRMVRDAQRLEDY